MSETRKSEGSTASKREFADIIPPGTGVWQDSTKRDYGTTVGGIRIYIDQYDHYVFVRNVNGISGASGLWPWQDVIRK